MRTTTIIIPCFNEASRLPARRFLDFAASRGDIRFLTVDDGSTDDTRDLLTSLARSSPVFSVLGLDRNVGKGEAVRQGVLRALAGDAAFVGFWDADLSAPLEAVDGFRADLEADPALEAVFGARVRMAGRTIERSAFRHYAGRIFATIADTTLGLLFYDSQCGAKLFRAGPCARALFEAPFHSRWLFDLEIALRLEKWGKSRGVILERLVHERPLESWRHHPDSRLTAGAGARALLDVLRLRRRYRVGRP
jgi:glycosyltransferase involved in cell wall biosynthesis